MQAISPFRVMEILARARAMEAKGRDIVHMEIGEPDFVSPQPAIDAGIASLRAGLTHYTAAAGLPALREAIAAYYAQRFGVSVDPAHIIVTPGSSGALQLVLGSLVNPGDEVLLTDPGYPCNRHMVSLFGGVPVPIAVTADDGFAVSPRQLRDAMATRTRALMLASPANPTGNLIGVGDLRDLNAVLRRNAQAVLICDEIYQGLQYDSEPETALALGDDNVVVINSFSKYFGMTGWRVGWAVAPGWLVEPMERLAQNIFLAAPTPAQHAAVAAFSPASMEILEARRREFEIRRDFLFDAVRNLGFVMNEKPRGAFYLYADAAGFTDDSAGFARELLESAGVAITPGLDFGGNRPERHVRFAYTTALDRLETGVERLRAFLRAGAG
ncbi:MAG: aminotransferase class I/II-fold pyridoxal phosphate-dependent enzyme [Chromatiaceae bacterium]|nr:aminotransferase class I/II-fold pyridoxal phosphate-dependent enzyme [Gammaproteobacteria bacterium]MCP5316820.1 aminotransferase class I/II-fold pyridoxal phosphate-dependent enzyme [Chromatiaceae bacterium]MCP5434352.1 aminotransferase class I/II-fold pyridoxal phosphate-dependent enzyme [Chromatiaceae bacterium]MCW5585070.1 aminotransferase class I/II-fold pyridoxal phosphate-dependent enzyme [Chromatiales bacterium]